MITKRGKTNRTLGELLNFLNSNKYDEDIYACSLNFDDLGLMFHYDYENIEKIEAITVGTNIFNE